ncbi:hypothetical protein K1719_023003 [Acacia pycnantha]|nr:hypothetical protein K1719_023003 [Acacia pycnantha]
MTNLAHPMQTLVGILLMKGKMMIKSTWRVNSTSSIMLIMSIFIWNCQGAAASKFQVVLKTFIKDHRPVIALVEVEPFISSLKAYKTINKIGLRRSYKVEANGFFGGIWLLSSDEVDVKILVNHHQFIHSRVNIWDGNHYFVFTTFMPVPTLNGVQLF